MKEYDESYLPCYSPDINGPIEKSWREAQRRVLLRASEIHSVAEHWRVIQEEWDGLEFEDTRDGEGGGWCGINHLVMRTPQVLEEVIKEGGFDMKFHQH